MVSWVRRNRLVLAAGLAAALPVIVSTVRALADGWLPLGDDALIAVRAYDVLSTHPPLVGPLSASSLLIGEPVLSPGPMLFWLVALPARLGPAAPALVMGVVNTSAVMGVVALARRRGGSAFMFAAGAALALMCASLDAQTLHDVWGPAAGLLPFTLLIFLAWSVAAGEHRLLPLAAVVASFVAQTHLTYGLPAAAMLLVAAGFLLTGRHAVSRRWWLATAAVLLACWSLPLVEEAAHRPGNLERVVQAATASGSRLGAAAGWHSVTRTAGVPPWWLGGPRDGFGRLADVSYAPGAGSVGAAVLLLAVLAAVAVAARRAGRRELAAAALLALTLLVCVDLVTATTPTSHGLFGVVGYTLWWASPAGMFAWLVLGLGLVELLRLSQPVQRAGGLVAQRLAGGHIPWALAGVLGVAAVAALVAAGGKPDRLARAYEPSRKLGDLVRAATPRRGTVSISGSKSELGINLVATMAYALRTEGVSFVTSSVPGIGARYDPARHPHDRSLVLSEGSAPVPAGAREVARVVLNGVPADGPPSVRGPHVFRVTLSEGAGGP